MKRTKIILFAALSMGLALVSCEKENPEVRSWTLDANGLLTKENSYFVGTDRSVPSGYYYSENITIGKFVLSHSWGDYGFGEGFTYTNYTDSATPGYTNLSAITADGVGGSTYFVANAGEFSTTPAMISFADGKSYRPLECYVTNSTYAYLAMKDGNPGYGTLDPFKQGDRFKLIITGYDGDNVTGKVTFYLASGTDIVNTWEKIDLSRLGTVTRMVFSLESSDVDPIFGMNTPSYFCLDRLTVSE